MSSPFLNLILKDYYTNLSPKSALKYTQKSQAVQFALKHQLAIMTIYNLHTNYVYCAPRLTTITTVDPYSNLSPAE